MDDQELTPDNPINKSMKAGGLESGKKEKPVASYKMIGAEKIPVSKSAGKLWKARLDHSLSVDKDNIDLWKECLTYFENTGHGLRGDGDGNHSRSSSIRGTHNQIFAEIENVVFAHIASIIPHVYSQNPTIEITPTKSENEPMAKALETLAKALINRRASPRVKIKELIRKMIVVSTLCKNSYAVITWTHKDVSSEQAIEDLQTLSKELQDAKKPQKIREIEGKLQALEQSIDFLSPAGPRVSFRLPWEIAIDTTTREDDGDDAKWMMVADMLPWTYLKAKFGTDDKDSKSLYQPTHMLRGKDANSDDVLMQDFRLIPEGEGQNYREFGFDDEQVYEQAQYVKVWMVYDKTTRRISMYNDKDWTWPLWVWDDPYHLQGFFNIVTMSNYTSPVRVRGKGEMAYVLDQQDSINEANDAKSRARFSLTHNIVYNSDKIKADQVAKLMEPGNDTALGIALGNDSKLEDHIMAFTPPIAQALGLLDKADSYKTMDRLLGSTDVMRGGQFNTNTTNDAVEAVTSVAQNRLDEKTDIVEDTVGNIMHKVLEMCVQFMDQQTAIELIGDTLGSGWLQLSPAQFAREYSLQVVGGSTAKPTSTYKQKQALDIGQVLGQYASASPVILLVILKVFERSFNEVVMTDEDWAMIIQSIEGQISGSAGGGNGEQPPEEQASLEEVLKNLPPEAQQAVELAVQQGVPVETAIQQVVEALQTQQGPAPAAVQ